MSYLRSATAGTSHCGWRVIALVSFGFCLLPALLGAFGTALLPESSTWAMPSRLLLISPLITAGFWALIGLASGWGLAHGIWGSLPAALIGALAGAAATWLLGPPELIALGAIFASFHRFTLALLRPLAF